ncbi:biotin-dependent carboxyltransferase family protein [Paracoccaceae bacterium]
MTRLQVLAAGPQVTLQDGGRPGLMRFGVPASGALDRKALTLANLALGNPPGAPGIEVSVAGLTLACRDAPVSVAVTGGGFIVEHNGRRSGGWQVFTLHPGDELTIRKGPWGSWAYLVVAGGVEAPLWLGSAATHGPTDLGGGRIAAGQMLQAAAPRLVAARALTCPVWARPRSVLHAVAGPQDRYFPPEALATFFASPFHLTDAWDRMGLRLRGPLVASEGALSIPSQAILRGSVQVAGDGVATVLLSDHQTTGGYPKIATLLADDIDGLVQLRPRDALRFTAITPEQAVALARQRAAAFAAFAARIAP